MFHKEGNTSISITLVVVAALLGIAYFLVSNVYVQGFLYILAAFILIIILQFFRNPKRHTLVDENTVVSPVDGKVVVIEEVFEKEYYKEKRLQVSVFMSPINVHVTRNPIAGKVAFSKYHSGKFLVAWHPKSSEENERTTVVLENSKISILYRQIAGALAKRIISYAKENTTVAQGADNGFIKFGSRVDVFLPIGTKVDVGLNEKVRGGETILARIES